MTSIKVKFRPSSARGGEGTIYYQITHDRKVRQYPTGYHAAPDDWQTKFSRQTKLDVERFVFIIKKLETSSIQFTTDDIIREFRNFSNSYSLFNFMLSQINYFREYGRARCAESYTAALRSFRTFRNGHDIMIDEVDSSVMEAYEAFLKGRNAVPNTISFYMRILRAVYNRAVESGSIEHRHPFKHVYTGIERTTKRAIPIKALRRLKTLALPGGSPQEYARDIFMLSFYMRGMSFVDMAFLRKSDLTDNHISYRRRKTGQRLTIAWTREMQEIVDRYPPNPTQYLLPILTKTESNERTDYRNRLLSINRHLKTVGRRAGLSIPLTLYCARHSWASAAKTKGIPLSIISEGMGHDSEMTTRIYLASLETSAIDRANALIIKSL